MQNDIHAINNKLDRVMVALMGSELSKDGGLIARIADLEEENEQLKKELESVKTITDRNVQQAKIIWGLASALGTGLLGFILNQLFNK